MTPQLSCYVSAFNLISHGLPYEEPLRTMVDFFDEVVVAVNTSKDNTLKVLQDLATTTSGRLKVISTDYLYTDVTFDGAIKNAALQACTQREADSRVYVQMDLDETVIPSQRDLWRQYATQLLSNPHIDCYMLPSVDLWGSPQNIRADKPIGLKFRMHKGGLTRGVLPQAWLNPSHTRFDTSKSDSTEPLRSDGSLARSICPVPPQYLHPASCFMLDDYPTVIHKGYLDYQQRIRINKAIWKDHWELRSGKPEKVATRLEDLIEVPLVAHRLTLS